MKLVKDSNIENEIKKVSDKEAEEAFKTILSWMGEDPNREGLLETPKRVVKAFKEYFKGYKENPNQILDKTFGDVEGYDDMVIQKNISVQSSVSSDLKKTVVGNMASRHKKVQIFENGKNTKTYFIGSPTSDHYGTYMLLEKNGKKSSEAYVMHLPGFNGFLESRFYTEIKDWKHTGVYTMNPENIKQIKVEHYESPEDSYVITQADGRFDFTTIDGVPVGDYNLTLLQNYVRTYEKIFYNQIGDYTETQVDSIKKEDPTYIVSVTDNADNVKQVFFTLKETGETMDSIIGKAIAYDVNMIHGYYPEGEEIYLFQYFSLGNMFAKKSYFIQK